jgi:D-alanine--poly(phosphoribitol) ligase subunit 1
MIDILATIHHWSSTVPLRIAHRSGERSLNYLELQINSDLLAGCLAGSLPHDASPIAVIGHKEPEMLVAFLGCVKSGHPYIPIDTSLPPLRVKAILEASRAVFTLTPVKIQSLLSDTSRTLPPLPRRAPRPEEAWYIIYTSGSTGEPKGVVITAGCLESFLRWMLAEQHLSLQNETFLNQAPFSFDLSVMDLYLSLMTGGTLFSLTQQEILDPASLFQALQRSQTTVWVSTPSFARMCLAEPTFSAEFYPSLNRFLFCGETLAPEVASALLDRFPQAEIWNTYGPTEATCATTSVRIDRNILASYSPLPIGYPKIDTRVMIMSDHEREAKPGERGEIIIAGPNVSPGYLACPELTKRAFFRLNGVQAYRTGDWGHSRDGLLFFDGRIDNQVKLHGYRIELGDVEANLCRLPEIQDAVVLPALKQGIPDHLEAFVILKNSLGSGSYEQAHTLRLALSQSLPVYMIPRRFSFVKEFPMTPNGKADRRKLAESLT